MSYTRTEEIVVYETLTCIKCGKRFRFTNNESEYAKSKMKEHTLQCDCLHDWSDWSTFNIGTWPDYEPYSVRYCSKCNKKEVR